MAATATQISDALALEGTYSLITGAAVITDVSNWAGIGVASPDTVKILFYILDSTGQEFYKNPGYDAAVFTSPDINRFGGTSTYSTTLPTDITGAYLTGQYTFNCKIQVVEGSDTTNATAVRYQNVSPSCNGIVPNVVGNVSYNTAIVTLTDYTNYKAYSALSNTIKLYPPASVLNIQAAQQATFNGTPATLTYEPPTGQTPYTGSWQWTLTADVTYTDSLTGASTTCRITAGGNFNVIQSQLCKVRCVLEKYRDEVYAKLANKETSGELALRNFIWADAEYWLAFATQYCGKPQTEIDIHVNKVYQIIGESWRTCSCGCEDGSVQPLVPTDTINGADGTDGYSFLSGTTDPAGGLGNVGDTYLNATDGSVFKKTGSSTWNNIGNIKGATGATGATGAAGAAGANGAAVLYSDLTAVVTTTTSLEVLKTYTMPLATLTTDGSYIEIVVDGAKLTANTFTTTAQMGVRFNGTVVAGWAPYGITNAGVMVIRLSRTGNTTASFYSEVQQFQEVSGTAQTSDVSIFSGNTIATLNFTTTAYVIDIFAISDVIGDLDTAIFTVTKFVK